MSAFLSHVLTDIRSGRETWRVYLLACLVAAAVSTGACLLLPR